MDQTDLPMLFPVRTPIWRPQAIVATSPTRTATHIIFTSDASGTSILPFERETYNASTGAVNFWVNVPTVSHLSDTVSYMFYGKSSVTTDQSNKIGVWDSSFKGVWHFRME
jgi:hypothetical protein